MGWHSKKDFDHDAVGSDSFLVNGLLTLVRQCLTLAIPSEFGNPQLRPNRHRSNQKRTTWRNDRCVFLKER